MSEPLCPACGRAPQTDERTGFCEACLGERRLERYAERRRAEALERIERWQERALSARRRWDAERQAAHRLRERVRPRRPAPRGIDPWQLACEALEGLEQLRPAAARSDVHEALEEVMEIVRRLAWGPVEVDERWPRGSARERPRPSP